MKKSDDALYESPRTISNIHLYQFQIKIITRGIVELIPATLRKNIERKEEQR